MCTDFPGSPHNGRGARSWWPSRSKERTLVPSPNRMTEVTGVEPESQDDMGARDRMETSWPSMTATEINLGFSKSLPLKHNFPNHTLKSACLRDLWAPHLCHLLPHSHLPGWADIDFFLQMSQSSLISSTTVTRMGWGKTQPVYKSNISFDGDSPIYNPVSAQVRLVE